MSPAFCPGCGLRVPTNGHATGEVLAALQAENTRLQAELAESRKLGLQENTELGDARRRLYALEDENTRLRGLVDLAALALDEAAKDCVALRANNDFEEEVSDELQNVEEHIQQAAGHIVAAQLVTSDNTAIGPPAVVCNDKNCGLHALHAKLPEPSNAR